TIIIGEATRRAAGDRIVVRELDTIAVYGRMEGTAVFELLAMAGESPAPDWATRYEAGLRDYRSRAFGSAIERFTEAASLRGGDNAAELMIERCQAFLRKAPPADWAGTTVLDMK